MDVLAAQLMNALNREWSNLGAEQAKATGAWTEATIRALVALKDTLSRLAHIPPESMQAFHHAKAVADGTNGEYLVDFSWTTWPVAFSEANPVKPRYQYEILLAAESEWGHSTSPGANARNVLDDFCKLVDTKARYKVMIFGYRKVTSSDFSLEALTGWFEHILRCHRNLDARERWYFVGVPWDGSDIPGAPEWTLFTVGVDGCLVPMQQSG